MSRSDTAEPLEFFTDRSLGRHQVPAGLRAAGFIVHTMAEVYGEEAGQHTGDEDWLKLCGQRGWLALHKDEAIGRPAQQLPRRELQSLIDNGVRSFCVMSQTITAADIIARYVRYQRKIINIATTRTGPYLYGLYADGMREVWPATWRKRGIVR